MSHALCHSLCFISSCTALYPCFMFSFKGCVPHSFIHFLTHPLTSAYSFLSRTHMPLSFDDSFVHTTHFDSDLLTNRSHTPYSLCFLIISFMGRCSPKWVNNRVDTSSHASLFLYLSRVWLAEYLPSFVISGSPLPFCTSVLTV